MNQELTTTTLESERARLIPFNIRGAQELNTIIYDDTIWKYMGHYIRNQEDLDSYIQSTINALDSKTAIPFLIIDKDYGELAGSTRFGKLDFNNKRAEIGWTWYGKEFQGPGLNGAVKSLMLEYGFNTLGFNRIQLGTDLRNIRSQKAIEKLGARKEGIRYSHYIDSEGEVQDDVYYSIVKEQWQEMNATSVVSNVL